MIGCTTLFLPPSSYKVTPQSLAILQRELCFALWQLFADLAITYFGFGTSIYSIDSWESISIDMFCPHCSFMMQESRGSSNEHIEPTTSAHASHAFTFNAFTSLHLIPQTQGVSGRSQSIGAFFEPSYNHFRSEYLTVSTTENLDLSKIMAWAHFV